MASSVTEAPTRRLTVFAQDPNVRSRGKVLTAKVTVPAEYLREGPAGHRVHVIDYDASTDRLLAPKPVGDADPFEDENPNDLVGNPHFHAQNVYAIVMSTLAHFERALGRRVQWGFRGHQIKVAPHAFADANAYYSREDEALMFGYFPGKKGAVFTCLSHDIVAHEATHALLDGLRRNATERAHAGGRAQGRVGKLNPRTRLAMPAEASHREVVVCSLHHRRLRSGQSEAGDPDGAEAARSGGGWASLCDSDVPSHRC